jgi:hypothetical protein
MSEWWTYRLSDFLLFSPRTYRRLFELYNEAIWPAQLLALLLGLILLGCLLRGERGRLVGAMLAAGWLWVAWAFHLERYATINWAAPWLAAGFAAEAALLAGYALADRLVLPRPADPIGRAGIGLVLFAVLAQPLVGPLAGRGWSAIEVPGIAPDPTVVATLGVLLARGGNAWPLLPIPLIWCAISGATLWAMDEPDAFVLPAVGLVSMTLAAVAPARADHRADHRRVR